jgi:orotidine-5'-phosphate decarboxylase
MSNGKRIILALDVPEKQAAIDLAESLRDEVAMVKVGLEGFVGHGPSLVAGLVDRGIDVFLDLKLHDIPRTAAAAARQAGNLGVRLLTVHAAGGGEMVRAVRDAVGDDLQVIAVTMLTSLDDAAARQLGFADSVRQTALRLGELARSGGAHGLVCSAHELATLRSLGGVRVVPGVRPAGAAHEDQKRVATPSEAVLAGGTWVVLGRPIIQAADAVAVARSVNAQIAATLAHRSSP